MTNSSYLSTNNYGMEKAAEDFFIQVTNYIQEGDTLNRAIKKSFMEVCNRNTPRTRKSYTYKGVTGTTKHICNVFNLNYGTVRGRLESGYSPEVAFSGKGVKRGRKKGSGEQHTFRGVTGNLVSISEHFGFNYKLVHLRIRSGHSVEASLEYYFNKNNKQNK